MVWRRGFLVSWLAGPLAACSDAPSESVTDQVRERLVGTWLREYQEQGTRVRRILVLESGGDFHEMSTLQSPGGAEPQLAQGSGAWLYDGTNLKRRYARINGQQPSAPVVPFVTFALRFPSRSQFVGVDHIRRREVSYHRVPDGTLP